MPTSTLQPLLWLTYYCLISHSVNSFSRKYLFTRTNPLRGYILATLIQISFCQIRIKDLAQSHANWCFNIWSLPLFFHSCIVLIFYGLVSWPQLFFSCNSSAGSQFAFRVLIPSQSRLRFDRSRKGSKFKFFLLYLAISWLWAIFFILIW